MKTLTAKFMHEKLKRNWTPADFATHLEISQEEFWELLKKQFPGKSYKEFKSALSSNESYRKRSKSHAEDSTSGMCCTENSTLIAAPLNEENSMYEEPDSQESISDEPTPEPDNTLERFNAELTQLLIKINEEELVHQGIVSSRIEFKKQLQALNEDLIKIRATVAEHMKSIDDLFTQLADSQVKMSESTEKLQILQARKVELISLIENAKKISILVCSTGEIEIDAHTVVEFPDWSDLFDRLVKEDELDSLTMKQIKSLAKVIAFARNLEMQGTPYEVFFEDPISEEYFEKAIS